MLTSWPPHDSVRERVTSSCAAMPGVTKVDEVKDDSDPSGQSEPGVLTYRVYAEATHTSSGPRPKPSFPPAPRFVTSASSSLL